MDLSIKKLTAGDDSGHGDPPPKHPPQRSTAPVEPVEEDTVDGGSK